MQPVYVVLTALAALLGALIFTRLHIPAGTMIGAVCGTVVLSLTMDCAVMPYAAKFLAQITAGAFIGCSIDRSDLKVLRGVYRPALLVIGCYLALNLLTGMLLWQIAGMDLLTSLLCAVPGGMSDVPLIAADMGAELSSVVVLQFVRLCSGLSLFPLWISHIPADEESTAPCEREKRKGSTPPEAVFVLLMLASMGGLLGRILRIPAGPLLFSIAVSLLFKLFLFPLVLPRKLKRCAQVLSGAYIGCSVTVESLRQIPRLLFPAVLVVLLYLGNAWLVGRILHKQFHIPRREATLMVTPAGASDMALISADLGVQSPTLIVVQLIRMLSASALFPQVCYWLAGKITLYT